MIIKLDFLSSIPGAIPKVEFNDDLGRIMEQMDDDFNLNHLETHRHYYMPQN